MSMRVSVTPFRSTVLTFSGGAFLGLTTGAEIHRWMFGLGYQGVWMSRNQHNEFSSSASDMETKGFTVRLGYRF